MGPIEQKLREARALPLGAIGTFRFGRPENSWHCYCAAGAIATAYGVTHISWDATDAGAFLEKFAREAYDVDEDKSAVPWVNDHEEGGAAELLDRAIAHAHAMGV